MTPAETNYNMYCMNSFGRAMHWIIIHEVIKVQCFALPINVVQNILWSYRVSHYKRVNMRVITQVLDRAKILVKKYELSSE